MLKIQSENKNGDKDWCHLSLTHFSPREPFASTFQPLQVFLILGEITNIPGRTQTQHSIILLPTRPQATTSDFCSSRALQSPEDETVRKNTFRLPMNHRHSKSRQITWHTADHEHEMVKKETCRAALCRCHRRAMGSVSRPIAMFSASQNSASE